MDDSLPPAQQNASSMAKKAMMESDFKGQIAKTNYGTSFWKSMVKGQTPEAALDEFTAKTSGMTQLVQWEVRKSGGSKAEAQETARLAMFHGIRETLDKFKIPVSHEEMASVTPSVRELSAAPHAQQADLAAAQEQADRLLLLLWFKRAKESLERGSLAR